MNDSDFMKEAIRLATDGPKNGFGGPFGAVIVKNGTIIGRGQNQVTSTFDPTAHAEVVAIRAACREIKDFSLKGTTLYTSCEPCPMCLAAIYWARIDTVFFGNTRQDASFIGFDDALIYEQIALPLDKRMLKLQQLLSDEAIISFQLWQQSSSKIPY